ncbi:MAG: energy-coupling factor ABC transporter ATP-binding protein [Homoserinimonas sp.]|nr:energy-coupling factor ABC transporter ATP-binding protein [Homoserinimonas sp.]
MAAAQSVPAARVSARGWGWRHASRKRWALRDLDLEIEPGERVLLLGASGSGKSTLLQALAGVLGGSEEGESEGELLIDGLPAVQARGRAGLVLQDPDSQVILARVGDDVAFGCENLGVPREEIWRRVPEALEAVGLELPLNWPTAKLSGGQKQRLALAGTLAMRPGLLLLDEPTANLDPEGVLAVRDAVARVIERTHSSLVVVEHRVDVWLPIVDRVIALSPEGVLLADGAPDVVLAKQATELADAGVWLPGARPPVLAQRGGPGPVFLSALDLTVGRRELGQPTPGFVREGLGFDVSAGTITALTGSNGSGKTTLALTLAGLLPPIGGEVVASLELRGELGGESRLRGEPGSGALRGRSSRNLGHSRRGRNTAYPIDWRSRNLLTRIGTVFQEPEHQFLARTVREELAVGPRALKLEDAEVGRRVDELLARLRLEALAAANPFTLSGGEKRRLSVATVLATAPRVLVLDEPTFGQDARTWAELVAILGGLAAQGSAIVTATHDQLLVEALADSEVRL